MEEFELTVGSAQSHSDFAFDIGTWGMAERLWIVPDATVDRALRGLELIFDC